jgi:hypothetical protein
MKTYRIIVESMGRAPEEVLACTVDRDVPDDSGAGSEPPSEAERLTSILETVGKAALASAAQARGNGVSGDWKQFRADGMLWFINRQLLFFGWSIVLTVDTETGEAVGIRPVRADRNGFSREDEIEGYAQVKAMMVRYAKRIDSDPST